MAKTSPQQFIQQVRQEVSKVTWPSRRETIITSAMVFAMATVAAIFFFLVDEVLNFGMRVLLGFG